MTVEQRHLSRVPTGITGFDELALGGLPAGRSTLVTGTPGSGKTLFAVEFLARGIQRFGEPGVFVTFEEEPDDIRTNAASLGFDIERWEKDGRWAFVDASLDRTRRAAELGPYDFGPLIARIEHAVRKTDARRVALDAMAAILSRFADAGVVRDELFHVTSALDELGVVTVITAEKAEEYDTMSRHGVEEFVHSNVVTLRNVLEDERRRRTIEILKLRGAPHRTGEWLFAIDPVDGILVLPLAFFPSRHRATQARVSSGIPELDVMSGGGFFRDSVVLLTGPTGAGKTLTCLQYAANAHEADERCLFYTFDETRDQLGRNAASWDIDLDAMEQSGKLRVVTKHPEMSSLEDHFSQVRHAIDEFDPARLVIDSLSALERVSTPRTLLDFLTSLGSLLRQREITTLLTALPPAPAPHGMAGSAATEVAGITDTTIRLHYFESGGMNQRTISVVQARGTAHDEHVRWVTIDEAGLHIGPPVSESSRP